MKTNNPNINIELITRYLAGETSSEEGKMLRDWIAASPANKEKFEHLQKVWTKLGETSPEQKININKEWTYHQTKMGRTVMTQSQFNFRPLLRIAASVILVLSLSVLAYLNFSSITVKTQHAEIREFMLPDGSEITLNANSKIRYKRNFQAETRSIALKGEAFFKVMPDSSAPFIITADRAEIRVLGTSFNVKAYHSSSAIQVTVAEGTVGLYDRKLLSKKVIATRGETAEFIRERNVIKKTANANQNYLAWKTRNMEFNNDDLNSVATTIGEVYHREVVVKTSGSPDCNFTAQFSDEELQTVLQVLENTLDITIEENDDVIYLLSDGCE